MTLTRLIGDIHGRFYDYQTYSIRDFKGPTIQIGDFGVGMSNDYCDERTNAFHADGTHRFIRGNHDNPFICKEQMVGYIADGTVENDVMFVGGAWSIDNPVAPPGWRRRTAGYDWWPEEECSDVKFEQIFETYKKVKPRVMITHTCPAQVAHTMFWGGGFIKGPAYPNRTESWFDTFFDAHQPDEWYFGHWHIDLIQIYGRTMFQCIGELGFVDVEL